jgi:hypothetical protein
VSRVPNMRLDYRQNDWTSIASAKLSDAVQLA